MSKGRLIRWSGLAGVASGLLAILTEVVLWAAFSDQPIRDAATSGTWIAMVMLSFLGGYCGLLALIGLYARQSGQTGRLGLIGFLVASLGMAFTIGYVWTGAFVIPTLAGVAPESLEAVAAAPSGTFVLGSLSAFLLFAVGWALVGIASVRAGVVPPAAAWLLVFGAILNLALSLAALPLTGVVFGAALIWLGWWLWSEKDEAPV